MDTRDIIDGFICAMTKNGCAPANPNDIEPTGKDEYYRIKDDRKDKRGGYCLTIESDGFAHGNFTNFRTGEKGKWNSSQESTALTPEERKELEERVKQSELRRAKEKAERQEAVSKQAVIDFKSFKLPDPTHPYLIKKNCPCANLKQDGNDLISPMVADKKLWGYQRITPDGDKYFITDGRKEGCYLPLVKAGEDMSIILIGEGVATAQTIREATSLPTYAAYDAGNILHVLTALKKENPNSKFIICADNDHETIINGKKVNTGIVKAQQAAAKVGGARVIYPEFDELEASGNTDFNDLRNLKDLETVRDRILSVMIERSSVANPLVVQEQGYTAPPINNIPLPEPEERIVINQGDPTGDFGLPFIVLGYKDNDYFYYSYKKRDIIRLAASAHSLMNLLQLAPLDSWESMFVNVQQNKIPIYAFNKLQSLAIQRGYFKEEDRIRGTGIWKDAGKIIVNCGNKVFVNGEEMDYCDIKSKYVYVTGTSMPSLIQGELTADFKMMREIFTMPTWENPASGVLLTGWVVIAPLCQVLSYRPHIFITGQAQAGKSTIISFIQRALHDVSLNADGSSSEASLRSAMGYNARPVVFDEAEGKGMAVTSMDAVLTLARLASTGGQVMKVGQKVFKAQSPFCFSAINPPIKNVADETRISRMVLKRNKNPDAKLHYKKLVQLADSLLTPEFSSQLITYTVRNLANIQKNIEILNDLLRDKLPAARAAQLIAPMLAGYYALESPDVLSEFRAKTLVDMYDWNESASTTDENDSERLIRYISQSIVKMGAREVAIGDLISNAYDENGAFTYAECSEVLKLYSIKVEPDKSMVYIGNRNHNLAKLLKETDWANNAWSRALGEMEGAEKITLKYFTSTDKQRAIGLPISTFVSFM